MTYGWCGSGASAPNLTSLLNKPTNPLVERCIELISADGELNDRSCATDRRFICEGIAPECSPTCSAQCVKDPALFNKQDQLLNIDSYGTTHTVGASTYLFSSDQVNAKKAHEICCSIGMKLISVETDEELKILHEIHVKKTSQFLDYWTSGSQVDCEFRFTWCATGVRFHRNDTRWIPGHPNTEDESQPCVVAYLNKTHLYLNDLPCSANNNFICEMPAVPKCTKVTCPDVECSLDAVMKKQSVDGKDINNGQFRNICGRQYFLNKNSTSYTKASLACCKMGMQLLSIETAEELECLKQNNSFGLDAKPLYFRTSSVSDGIGCKGVFGWCPSGDNVSLTVPWAAGEPSTSVADKCGTVFMQMGGGPTVPAVMLSEDCDRTRWFICEGPAK
ncbi:uncharacterized protein LOC132200957 [Neocloeon triangulifer]|uniref:uncharacterized protein LOC132200957 n=1 Tax=Neocloeon triangulifer TaxID=2078957 RepID=UPI00286EC61E|nr:uncharacterized protein LOC132200957 [Neocloeon triangulifer]